ncbi:MAG: hypothetical protein AAFV53_07100 [Myxococcota bacterium]
MNHRLFSEVQMDHPSTLKLHQFRYNELSDDESRAIREHIRGCELCAQRLAAMDNRRAAFLLEPVPQAIKDFNKRKRVSILDWLRRPAALGVLATAAAAFLVVNLSPGIFSTQVVGDMRKGGGPVEVLVKEHGVLAEWETIRPDDQIQLRIPPGEWQQVWVGDGRDWLGSFDVEPSNRWTLMPFSLTIDAAPGDESIVVVLANHPIGEQEANEAAEGYSIPGVVVHQRVLSKEQ